jgi:hypothetical protein
MDISFEFAFLIFRKWETESALITAALRFGGSGASCTGSVSFLDSELMVILSPDSASGMHIDLGAATGFEYSDSREVAPEAKKVIGEIVRIMFAYGVALLYVGPD